MRMHWPPERGVGVGVGVGVGGGGGGGRLVRWVVGEVGGW